VFEANLFKISETVIYFFLFLCGEHKATGYFISVSTLQESGKTTDCVDSRVEEAQKISSLVD